MGISLAISMPSTILFSSFLAIRHTTPLYISLPILYTSLVGFAASFSAHPIVNYTALFGKTPEGALPWWSQATFFPYLVSVKAYVYLRRSHSSEPIYTEVGEGLFVGAWPCTRADLPPGYPGIIDCTCELARSKCCLEMPYLCVRTWDTRGPQPGDIESAVRWAIRKRGQNLPIFIHCAFGHGRSVAVMCALLVALGISDTWQNAETLIREHRPKALLNREQRYYLAQWRPERQYEQASRHSVTQTN